MGRAASPSPEAGAKGRSGCNPEAEGLRPEGRWISYLVPRSQLFP